MACTSQRKAQTEPDSNSQAQVLPTALPKEKRERREAQGAGKSLRMHERVSKAEQIVGRSFTDRTLLQSALTHSSAVEGLPVSASYERLEFLGDSILGAIVAAGLFRRYPELDEGKLTTMKIALVSGEMLAGIAEELGLAELIVFGQSEHGTQVRGMRHALEDVYEALIGALFMDGGIAAAREFIERTLMSFATPELATRALPAKSRLQEFVQRDHRKGPEYKLVSTTGPAHSPMFTSVVLVDGIRVGRGVGSSKKKSEASAAEDALIHLGYAEDEAQTNARQEG